MKENSPGNQVILFYFLENWVFLKSDLEINFPNVKYAQIVANSLKVDVELRPEICDKVIKVENSKMIV